MIYAVKLFRILITNENVAREIETPRPCPCQSHHVPPHQRISESRYVPLITSDQCGDPGPTPGPSTIAHIVERASDRAHLAL